MKTVIIVPTFNERDNIAELIQALQDQFRTMSHDMHVLVVDDESPDGTAQVVQDVQTRFENVHLIQGKKAGLGAAYIRGMRHATARRPRYRISVMPGLRPQSAH